MALSEEDKKALLGMARATIESYVRDGRVPDFDVTAAALLEKRGAFVTLHKNGRLRGCIGLFACDKPLYRTVIDMAVAAATQDPRFPPVSPGELDSLRIEISVLSPMKKVEDVGEIEVGRHGIYIVKGGSRGVLLPQVAVEHGFDREEFLDQTCLKAGLPPGCWRQCADIYIFEAEVFSEGD